MNQLTEKLNLQREEIIKDFDRIGFKPTSYVHWSIDFPEEQKSKFSFPSMTFYPRIIQHAGFSVWFEFQFRFTKSEKEKIYEFLFEQFKKLTYKPVRDDNRPHMQNHFSVGPMGFTMPKVILDIPKSHPYHGNFESSFFISPDYPELILE